MHLVVCNSSSKPLILYTVTIHSHQINVIYVFNFCFINARTGYLYFYLVSLVLLEKAAPYRALYLSPPSYV
jgi:hypothetical protein